MRRVVPMIFFFAETRGVSAGSAVACRFTVEVPQWQVDVPRGASCAGSTGVACGEYDRDSRSLEKIVESLEIHTVQGVQTCENLNTALVRHVAQAETVEDVETEKVVDGWPHGRRRMATRSSTDARTGGEPTGVRWGHGARWGHCLRAHEHCWRPGEAPLVLQWGLMDEVVRAVHRQGRRQPRWHKDRFGALLPANLRLPRSSRLLSWKLFLLLSGVSNSRME